MVARVFRWKMPTNTPSIPTSVPMTLKRITIRLSLADCVGLLVAKISTQLCVPTISELFQNPNGVNVVWNRDQS